jgi:uncharacterized membrane protein
VSHAPLETFKTERKALKEGITLTLYTPVLALGVSLILIGMVLLLLTLKPAQRKHEISRGGFFVGVIGFIPIVFGGRRMLKFGLLAILMLTILMGLALINPSLIGW